MKAYATILGLLLSLSTFASPVECTKLLTNDFELSSRPFSLNVDTIDTNIPETDRLAHAHKIVREVIKSVGCEHKDINFAKSPTGTSKSKCSLLSPGRTASMSCYVESNIGFFFVMWDMNQTANVIYNIWD